MAWIPSLLISLIAVLAFLYLAYHSRAQIDKLQRTLQDRSEQMVEDFLQRESRLTRHRLQVAPLSDNSNESTRWLAHMRRCWLDAELAALVDRGQRNSDYNVLKNAAMPLMRLTQRTENKGKSAPSPSWSNTESKQYLAKTRAAISSQKKYIQEFKARNPSSSDSTQNSINQIPTGNWPKLSIYFCARRRRKQYDGIAGDDREIGARASRCTR